VSTTTTTPGTRDATPGNRGPQVPPPTQFAPAGRAKRNPRLLALSLALIATGGVAAYALYNSADDSVPVVALTKTVARGEVIDRSDLTTAQAVADPAVKTVPAAELNSIVGKRAAIDLPAGLLPPNGVTTKLTPGQGRSLVGLQLKFSQLPASPLSPGDQVRLVELPTEGSNRAVTVPPTSAIVVSTPAGAPGQTARVDVELPAAAATLVATDAAQGRIVLIVDSRER
jgi:hypothetical protein